MWWGPQHPSVGGGAELRGRGPRKCTVREQGPQQSTVRERRSVWWGPQHPSVGGGRSYRSEAHGIRPWVETQVCKVTINCSYRCGTDRISHLLKNSGGRVISAIRYSVGARVYLPVIPSIMIRAPRMIAVRGPGDKWREGRVLLPERRSGGDENRRGKWREGRVSLPEQVHGARAEFCCRSRYMARGPSFAAVAGTWREGQVLLP